MPRVRVLVMWRADVLASNESTDRLIHKSATQASYYEVLCNPLYRPHPSAKFVSSRAPVTPRVLPLGRVARMLMGDKVNEA